jgi:hypothetical protein
VPRRLPAKDGRGAQIERQDAVDLIVRYFLEGGGAPALSRVVDQDVNTAKRTLGRLEDTDGRIDGRKVGRNPRNRRGTAFCKRNFEVLQSFGVAAMDRQMSAFSR